MIFIAIIGVGTAFAVAFGYLSFTGYCYARHGWLSDQELIDAAIKYELSHVRATYELATISYSSPAAFREENPGCCDIDRSGEHPLLQNRWTWFFGGYVATVNLWYRFQRTGDKQFWVEIVFLNACGRFLERFGYPTEIGLPKSKP